MQGYDYAFPHKCLKTQVQGVIQRIVSRLLSYGSAIAITALLCTVTSLILGVLLGALLHHLISRAPNEPHHPSHNPLPQIVINEEVEICTTKQKKAIIMVDTEARLLAELQ